MHLSSHSLSSPHGYISICSIPVSYITPSLSQLSPSLLSNNYFKMPFLTTLHTICLIIGLVIALGFSKSLASSYLPSYFPRAFLYTFITLITMKIFIYCLSVQNFKFLNLVVHILMLSSSLSSPRISLSSISYQLCIDLHQLISFSLYILSSPNRVIHFWLIFSLVCCKVVVCYPCVLSPCVLLYMLHSSWVLVVSCQTFLFHNTSASCPYCVPLIMR